MKTAHNSDVGVRFIGPATGLDKSSPYNVRGTPRPSRPEPPAAAVERKSLENSGLGITRKLQ
jgi:hypothetical protein